MFYSTNTIQWYRYNWLQATHKFEYWVTHFSTSETKIHDTMTSIYKTVCWSNRSNSKNSNRMITKHNHHRYRAGFKWRKWLPVDSGHSHWTLVSHNNILSLRLDDGWLCHGSKKNGKERVERRPWRVNTNFLPLGAGMKFKNCCSELSALESVWNDKLPHETRPHYFVYKLFNREKKTNIRIAAKEVPSALLDEIIRVIANSLQDFGPIQRLQAFRISKITLAGKAGNSNS